MTDKREKAVELPTLDVGGFDPFTDTIVIEGTKYSGAMFRDAFGIKAMIGQIIRIESHEGGVVTVTRMRDLELKGTKCKPDSNH